MARTKVEQVNAQPGPVKVSDLAPGDYFRNVHGPGAALWLMTNVRRDAGDAIAVDVIDGMHVAFEPGDLVRLVGHVKITTSGQSA